MPLPRLTDKILASSKPIEPGWSLIELTDIRSSSAKSGDGTNYFFDFEGVAGPNSSEDNKGRSVTLMISGKALDAGVAEVCANYSGILCALTNCSESEVSNVELDENLLKGKKCWADIQKRVQDGKTYSDFKAFSPATEIPF